MRTEGAITVVSGLPRSGTSLMMQMLRAGGMLVASDGMRSPDEDNPRGYFELEAVKKLRSGDAPLLEDLAGKAVKIVSALLRHLPGGQSYRVILMERRLDEVLSSQRVMLLRRGAPADSDDEVLPVLRREVARTREWLAGRGDIATLQVDYGRVITAPRAQADRVNGFLGGLLDAAAMAAVVEPGLHRRRGQGHR